MEGRCGYWFGYLYNIEVHILPYNEDGEPSEVYRYKLKPWDFIPAVGDFYQAQVEDEYLPDRWHSFGGKVAHRRISYTGHDYYITLTLE